MGRHKRGKADRLRRDPGVVERLRRGLDRHGGHMVADSFASSAVDHELRGVSATAWVRGALGGAMLLACLSGCGQTDSPSTIRLPLLTGFDQDPVRAGMSKLWAESLVYRGLYQFDTSLNVVPDLAVAMPTISADATTYTFGISPSARFADGRPVTAADVAFSFTRALSEREHSAAAWFALHDIVGSTAVARGSARTLTGIRILGRRVLSVRLSAPAPDFLCDLALPVASILEESIVRRFKNWAQHDPAAGPFVLQNEGKVISLKPNRYYLEGTLNVDGIELHPVRSAAEALDLYKRRQLDATPVPDRLYGFTASEPTFVWSDEQRAYYLALPPRMPETERAAIAEGLNTSDLNVTTSTIDPLASIVPTQVVPAYSAIPTSYAYGPQTAASVLAGYPAISILMRRSLRSTAIAGWLTNALGRVSATRAAVSKSASGPRLVAITARLPVAGSWLHAAGRAEWGRLGGRFAETLQAATTINLNDGLGPQITEEEAAEKMLLRPPLMIPLGVQKAGYLIDARLQGLVASPLGLEPSNENWTSVSFQ